jgi:hypothetical protein
MNAETPSWEVLVGFGVLLVVLLLILKGGKPRTMPTVVQSQTPQQWTDDPISIENRRKAVAAAYAFHLNTPSEGPTK